MTIATKNSQTKEGMTFLKIPASPMVISAKLSWINLKVGFPFLLTGPRKPKGGAKIWSPVASFR